MVGLWYLLHINKHPNIKFTAGQPTWLCGSSSFSMWPSWSLAWFSGSVSLPETILWWKTAPPLNKPHWAAEQRRDCGTVCVCVCVLWAGDCPIINDYTRTHTGFTQHPFHTGFLSRAEGVHSLALSEPDPLDLTLSTRPPEPDPQHPIPWAWPSKTNPLDLTPGSDPLDQTPEPDPLSPPGLQLNTTSTTCSTFCSTSCSILVLDQHLKLTKHLNKIYICLICYLNVDLDQIYSLKSLNWH